MHVKFFFFFIFMAIKFLTWVCKNLDFDFDDFEFGKKKSHRRKHRKRYRSNYRKKEIHKPRLQFKKICKGLRGKIRGGDQEQDPHISFSSKNQDYQLFITESKHIYNVRILARWPNEQYRLKLMPEQWKGIVFKGQQDIEVGDREFDQDFVVQSNDPGQTQSLFDDILRKRLRSHLQLAYKRLSINISGGIIEFGGVVKTILANQQVIALAKNFAAIHQLMIQNSQVSAVNLKLTLVEKDSSTCLVCGDTVFETNSVSCQRCGIHYHADCWEYMGKCSTYGCRSRKAK